MQIQVSVKNKKTIANSVDPDEMAHYEPSQLDLQYLHMYWFWSAGLKGLTTSAREVTHLWSVFLEVSTLFYEAFS